MHILAAALGEHFGGHFEREHAKGLDLLHAHQQEALGAQGIEVKGGLAVIIVVAALQPEVVGVAGQRGLEVDNGVGLAGLVEGVKLNTELNRLLENGLTERSALFTEPTTDTMC
ncbi:MAG: hypothetical protein EOO62_39310, partial [Hymenobacter sp.]